MGWPKIEGIESTHFRLEPISVRHALEMVGVLADPSIYKFTGGEAPSLEQLQRRYATQSVRHSEDGLQGWFNWTVRSKASDALVGFVQATVEQVSIDFVANIAWVIAPSHQGRGIATEATTAMNTWLRANGVDYFVAYIHPDHSASMSVARKQGLRATSSSLDGEIRWES